MMFWKQRLRVVRGVADDPQVLVPSRPLVRSRDVK